MSYPIPPAYAKVGGATELTVPPGYSSYTGAPYSANPAPLVPPPSGYLVIGSLNPPFSPIGAPDFTLLVIGEGFVAGSKIVWNGTEEPTTFVDSKTLSTVVQPSTATVETTIPVHVLNPDGGRSRDLPFRFAGTPWVPPVPLTLTGVAPATVPLAAGSGVTPTTFTLTGTGFKAGSTIKYSTPGAPTTWISVATTYVSATSLTCSLALNDATAAGTWRFTVTEGTQTTAPATATVTVA